MWSRASGQGKRPLTIFPMPTFPAIDRDGYVYGYVLKSKGQPLPADPLKPSDFYLVRKRGLEPLSLSALAPKASVFAISPLPHSFHDNRESCPRPRGLVAPYRSKYQGRNSKPLSDQAPDEHRGLAEHFPALGTDRGGQNC